MCHNGSGKDFIESLSSCQSRLSTDAAHDSDPRSSRVVFGCSVDLDRAFSLTGGKSIEVDDACPRANTLSDRQHRR